MKITAIALALILSSLFLSAVSSASSVPPGCVNGHSQATSCTAIYTDTVYVSGFGSALIPCLNHGQGESVVFSGIRRNVFYYTVTDGKRNGFFLFTGGSQGLTGTGQTTGLTYTAWGTEDYAFENWVPYFPDGLYTGPTNPDGEDGEGSFSITDDWQIKSSTGEVHVWHRRSRWVETQTNGIITSQDQPDEVVCE